MLDLDAKRAASFIDEHLAAMATVLKSGLHDQNSMAAKQTEFEIAESRDRLKALEEANNDMHTKVNLLFEALIAGEKSRCVGLEGKLEEIRPAVKVPTNE